MGDRHISGDFNEHIVVRSGHFAAIPVVRIIPVAAGSIRPGCSRLLDREITDDIRGSQRIARTIFNCKSVQDYLVTANGQRRVGERYRRSIVTELDRLRADGSAGTAINPAT